MRLLRIDWDEVTDWLQADGIDVLLILAAALIAYVVFRSVFPRLARAAMMRGAHPPDEEMRRRAETIVSVVDRTLGVVLILVALVTILSELNVNITAIVTGLGITGLALALGSQQLVRDAINGIFLLAEDQYRTGDVVTVAGVTGTVEAISLRRTILRDDDGTVHSVPNGSIDIVANHTRDYAQVNVRVHVAVGEDLGRVAAVVDQVARQMADDSNVGALLIEQPRFMRVDSVGNEGLVVVVTARTQPRARWQVAGELRGRMTEALIRAGVRVPYPVVSQAAADNQAEETQGGDSKSSGGSESKRGSLER
jgi:moderate conductance mechanosensitive channel